MCSRPVAKRVKYLSTLPTISDSIVARAMRHHLERQRPMMSAFLDTLGISHEDGLIAEETLPKPDSAKLQAAAKDLVEVPSRRRVAAFRDARRAGSGHVGRVGGTLSVVGRRSLVVSRSRQSESAVLVDSQHVTSTGFFHCWRARQCLHATSAIAAQDHAWRGSLEAALRALILESGAEVAVAFRTLDGRSQVLIDPDKPFHAASTMKVPVMIELFRQARMGTVALDQPLAIRNEFRSIVDGSTYKLSEGDDSDKAIYAAIGKTLTLEQLNEAMITVSSNFATNLLIEKLGVEKIRATVTTSAPTACRCCAVSKIRRRRRKG